VGSAAHASHHAHVARGAAGLGDLHLVGNLRDGVGPAARRIVANDRHRIGLRTLTRRERRTGEVVATLGVGSARHVYEVARAVATLAAERHGANDLPGGIYHVHLPEFRVGNVCGSAGALEHRHSEAPLAGTAAAAA